MQHLNACALCQFSAQSLDLIGGAEAVEHDTHTGFSHIAPVTPHHTTCSSPQYARLSREAASKSERMEL